METRDQAETQMLVMFNIAVMVVTCIVYLAMFLIISPKLSTRLSHVYETQLTLTQQLDWNARINSTINAVLSTMMAAATHWYDGPYLYKSAILRTSQYAETAASLLVGYMFADLITIAWYWEYLKDILIVIHHVTAIFVGTWYPMVSRLFHWFGTMRLFSEASTPFINLRWFLDLLGYDHGSLAYVINGILMTLVFFVARILVIPYMWNVWYIQPKADWDKVSRFCALTFFTGSFVFDAFNVFWMLKIFKGLMKTIHKMMKEAEE